MWDMKDDLFSAPARNRQILGSEVKRAFELEVSLGELNLSVNSRLARNGNPLSFPRVVARNCGGYQMVHRIDMVLSILRGRDLLWRLRDHARGTIIRRSVVVLRPRQPFVTDEQF